MSKSRNAGITVLLAAAMTLAGCGADPGAGGAAPTAAPARPAGCTPPASDDLGRASGWLSRIATAPGTVGVLVDDGRGTVVRHGADAALPLASAVKVVHLAAYGRAVAEGRIAPGEPVAVADWERWYLPGTDGGAHPQALARLGARPTVTVDELVSAMIRESDNAATDWLRARLGDAALLRAAADAGWTPFDLPSQLGGALALVLPELVPPVSAPREVRSPAENDLARRYAGDPAFRAAAQQRLAAASADPAGLVQANRVWAPRTAAGTAEQLAAVHRALATGSYGPGSDVAVRQLSWQGPAPGVGTLGFKAGSLAGVLTFGGSLRREDGTVATAVVLARDLPAVDDPSAQVRGQQQLALGAMRDPAVLARLACVA